MVIEQLSEQRERMILNDLKREGDKGAISDSNETAAIWCNMSKFSYT